jgi:hypothetical protein
MLVRRWGRHAKLTVAPDPIGVGADEPGGASVLVLGELVPEGARRMLAAALEAEVAAYIDTPNHEVDCWS